MLHRHAVWLKRFPPRSFQASSRVGLSPSSHACREVRELMVTPRAGRPSGGPSPREEQAPRRRRRHHGHDGEHDDVAERVVPVDRVQHAAQLAAIGRDFLQNACPKRLNATYPLWGGVFARREQIPRRLRPDPSSMFLTPCAAGGSSSGHVMDVFRCRLDFPIVSLPKPC